MQTGSHCSVTLEYLMIKCKTRGDNILHHVYTNITKAYKAIHLSLLLFHKYRHVKPSVRVVKVWSEGADSAISA